MTTELLEKQNRRIGAVDALRGFAVMAILFLHCIEHFIFSVYPEAASQPEWLNALDKGIFTVTFSLFAGKAYAIFALLFGFSFYIQYSNQQAKGKDFGPRFLWRLLLLTIFATLNAAFFPAGDVLLLFCVTGVMLFVVRNWSSKAILIIAIICLLQPYEWTNYIISLFNPNYTPIDLGVGAMYGEMSQSTKEGDFLSFIWKNVTLGQKASLLWAVGAGRFVQTIGLLLLGYLIGRKQLFITNEANNKFWIKTLIISAVIFAPLFELKSLFANSDQIIVKNTVATIFDMWQKLAFTFVLISSFILLYQKATFQKWTSSLTYYGRMSLTNYVSQSIIGALIFFPIGLYLAPYCGYTVSLLIAFVIFFFQVKFCKWWLQSHKQGPLEKIWHTLTWIKS